MKTSITFLKSKYERDETVKKIMDTDADYIHVDIMDGKFVPRVVLSIDETKSLFENSIKPLDIHLMCEDPLVYIDALSHLNVKYFTIHAEITKDIAKIIDHIHDLGIQAGIAICQETPVEKISNYLDRIENVLIMGVIPGYGGQKLIRSTVDKIDELRTLREKYNYHYQISLDGGVNADTRMLLDNLDIIVAGSYVCESDDYQKTINTLR